MQSAIAEIVRRIRDRYPEATFEADRGEDPAGVYLIATVDVDDPDEVLDLVIDRLLDVQIEDGLALHVVPVRTPERAAALRSLRARPRGEVVGAS